MKCPNCGVELHCPCNNCAKANKGKVKWIWVGEEIKCPKCGYKDNCDSWESTG